jgi:hypothetical protein
MNVHWVREALFRFTSVVRTLTHIVKRDLDDITESDVQMVKALATGIENGRLFCALIRIAPRKCHQKLHQTLGKAEASAHHCSIILQIQYHVAISFSRPS